MNTRTDRNTFGALAFFAFGAAVFASGTALAADRTGKEVVKKQCVKCHGPGKDGAPRIGNAYEWAPHAKFGLEQLTINAITGIRRMPAHGGQAELTDLEISRAIAYMVSNGQAKDPDRPYAKPDRWSGEMIVAEACVNCHGTGKEGAPKIGDADAWLPRLKLGLDNVASSAIKGHNSMPARGGLANLSDVEIKSAVSYMVSRIKVPRQP